MSEGIAFLLWLVFVGISAIIIGYFLKYHAFNVSIKKEPFLVVGCPSGTTNYITDSGESNCCNGDIVDGECNGNNVCTLSPNNREGLPTCAELHTRAAEATGNAKCPGEIPNYFASSDGSLKGCSVSNIMPDGSGPINTAALQCILYPTAALDSSRLDSCQNYIANKMALDAAKASCAAPGSSSSAAVSSASSSNVNFLGGASTLVTQLASLPAAVANPTGYVMSGDDITGQIPVQRVISGIIPNGADCTIYLSQNGSSISLAVALTEKYMNIFESRSAPGKLSDYSFTDMPGYLNSSFIKLLQTNGTIRTYTVSKVGQVAPPQPSASRPTPPSSTNPPRVPSSTNPSDYILTGGKEPPLSGDIQVTKIINSNMGQIMFYAQDGPIIRQGIVSGPIGNENRWVGGGSARGDISNVFKYANDYTLFNALPREPGGSYTIKKKDGTETYAP